MDASTTLQAEACCDACGYPRRGLPANARCPECGEPAPQLISAAVSVVAQTTGELYWLRAVAVGLLLLLLSSISALQVALVMPIGSFSLGAVNFPGPKVHAAALIQRSIGGQPGPWGVAGTLAVFFNLTAVWLLTERRSLRGDMEGLFSLRRLTRWFPLITVGGLAGMLLSGADPYVPPRGDVSGMLLIYAVVVCELPSNALLYLYLRRLAGQFQNPRAAALLGFCVWIIPALMIAGAILIGIDSFQEDFPPHVWKILSAGYGGAAVAAGAAATAAVGYLLVTAAFAAFGAGFNRLSAAVQRAPNLIAKAAVVIERDAGRWCAVVGLILWLWLLPGFFSQSLSQRSRAGLLGNVPTLNFPGPKVVAPLYGNIDEYDDESAPPGAAPLLNLLAIWLITCPFAGDGAIPALRRWARWSATIALALPLGIQLGLTADQRPISPSYTATFIIIFCEVPSTILVYLHLSRIAAACAGPASTLKKLAFGISIVAFAPLVGFLLAQPLRGLRHRPIVGLIASADVALALAVTFIAVFALSALAWNLARRPAAQIISRSAPTQFH